MFKPKIDKECLFCGKVFQTTDRAIKEGRGKHCSKLCQSKSARTGSTKVCEFCHNTFYANPSMIKAKKCRFCSFNCHIGWKRKNNSLFSGENSPTWEGGKSTINATIRASSEYKLWRKAVFERDNYTCIWCKESNGNGKAIVLNADHIKPFAFFPELRFEVSNGRTLCADCHKYTASYMGRSKRYFRAPDKFIPRKTRIEYGGMIIGPEEHDAIFHTVLSQGGKRWTIGPESIAFEEELAKEVGVKRAVVVNSGSSALLIAMTALKLPKGSKVIIPAVNFPTAFNAILQNNLVPLVVDVDIDTLNLDLDKVKEAMSDEVSAVIAVDIAGNPVDLVKLRGVVGDKVKIILDDCDGLGGTIDGKYKEVYADVSCVSFHAAHIITMGEGGAVLTNDEDLANTALKMREWGRASGTDRIYEYPGFPTDYKERYVYEEIGYNLKPLELQCAMGRVQLKKIGEFKKARKANFAKLKQVFDADGRFKTVSYIGDPCWFSFPLLCEGVEREKVMRVLEENNIECRTIFSGNITLHPAYKDSAYEVSGTLTNADKVMRDGMFLSVHPSITDEMITFIDQVISKI